MVNYIIKMFFVGLLLGGFAEARAFSTNQTTSYVVNANLQSELFAFQESPNPQKVENYIRSIDKFFTSADDEAIKRAYPTIAGWLAGVFLLFPDNVDGWISPRRSRATSGIIAWALSIVGSNVEAEQIAKQEGLDLGKMSPELRNISVLSSTPNDPVSLDLLWGAAFATGDKRYVKTIASTLDDPNGANYFVALKQLLSGQRSLSSFGTELDHRTYAELAVKYAAVALLASNAAKYEFVGDALEDYIDDNSHPNAARELLRFAIKSAKGSGI